MIQQKGSQENDTGADANGVEGMHVDSQHDERNNCSSQGESPPPGEGDNVPQNAKPRSHQCHSCDQPEDPTSPGNKALLDAQSTQ